MPPFWRTWWFYALAALTLGLIVFMIYKFRISRLERANAAQAAFSQQLIASQENERKRIALTIFKILTKA